MIDRNVNLVTPFWRCIPTSCSVAMPNHSHWMRCMARRVIYTKSPVVSTQVHRQETVPAMRLISCTCSVHLTCMDTHQTLAAQFASASR